MKKIISTVLICSMLFSTTSAIYVNAESTESKLKTNQEKQDELDVKINNLNEKTAKLEEKINQANETVSYTHLTLPTKAVECRSRWSPYH